MTRTNRSQMAVGVFLVLLGAVFLAMQVFPAFGSWFENAFAWPVIIILVGAALLIIGLMAGAPGMAVPAAIVAGIGGILYYQNATGNWESWAYAWALIPGFVGVGIMLAGLLGDSRRRNLTEGARMILISLVLFFIFGSFLGGMNFFGPYWPVLLIALGLLMFARAVTRREPK